MEEGAAMSRWNMASVNGKSLWVSDIGDGRTVVFVHGLGTTSMIYQPLVEALGTRYRTIRFDLEGHGRSPLAAIPTIQTWADDLGALLETKRIDRATVIGHSMGSIVAQRFAATRTHMVERLVLLGPLRAPLAEDGWPTGRRVQREVATAVRLGGMDTLVDAIIEYGLSPTTRRDRPAVSAFVVELALGQTVDGYAAASEALAGAEAIDLDTITMEALLITGADDLTAPPRETHELAAALPKVRVKILQEWGHFTTLEQTSAVNELVNTFI
jgi:pimeloyl-ACP methyl ester carboxylesterase